MRTTQMLTRTPGVRGNPTHNEIKKAALTDFMAGDTANTISKTYGISNMAVYAWSKQDELLKKLGSNMTPAEVMDTRKINLKGRTRKSKTEALSSTIRTSSRKYKNNKTTSNPSSSPVHTAVHYCPCCGTDMFAVGVALAASKGH